MNEILKSLWQDEQGFVVSTELILLATIVVIGLLVGLVVWRDAVVQELGDTGAAIGQFNQSYSIEVLDRPDKGISVKADTVVVTREFGCVDVEATFRNFAYLDQADICDGQDVANQPPAGISFTGLPSDEGN